MNTLKHVVCQVQPCRELGSTCGDGRWLLTLGVVELVCSPKKKKKNQILSKWVEPNDLLNPPNESRSSRINLNGARSSLLLGLSGYFACRSIVYFTHLANTS